MSERWDDAETTNLRAEEPQAPAGRTVGDLADALARAVEQGRYNCACQVGGVDAMSVDTDWLERIAADLRALAGPSTAPSAGCCRDGAPITTEDVEQEISGG